MNKMNRNERRDIHSQNREPIVNMNFLPVILLAVACQAYTPITERSWVKFHKVKDPTYETIPLHGEPDIIHATHILIEERISTLSMMVRKSIRDFQSQMKRTPQTLQHASNELPHPKQIMDLLGSWSYDINMECCLTTTARSSLG